MTLLPLLPAIDPSAIVADYRQRQISRAEFLSHIFAVAAAMPAGGNVLNLCSDRYAFAVGLFAAIAKNAVTILPNSAAPEHIASVSAQYTELRVLGDRVSPPLSDLPFIHVDNLLRDCFSSASTAPATTPTMPMIDYDQIIARVYTSGSTGAPKAHQKTFGRMRRNILAGAERFWPITGGACSVIGTTPIRHMYGLESSVLLPIFGGGRFSSQIPFFPADIAHGLTQMPAPRLLVSTPFHLRKMIESGAPLPPIAAVLSATAPLPKELAQLLTQTLQCPVLEIYGSTETGQMATRLPNVDLTWQTLADVELVVDGDNTWAHGDVYEEPQLLNDIVELISPSQFQLVDRKTNIINVAGKRNTLSCLNTAIAQLPGVVDAVFFMPGRNARSDIERPAAFVVAPGVAAADLMSALRTQIDPVFLPRPLIFVDALPRDGNGKLQAAALQAMIERHLPGHL